MKDISSLALAGSVVPARHHAGEVGKFGWASGDAALDTVDVVKNVSLIALERTDFVLRNDGGRQIVRRKLDCRITAPNPPVGVAKRHRVAEKEARQPASRRGCSQFRDEAGGIRHQRHAVDQKKWLTVDANVSVVREEGQEFLEDGKIARLVVTLGNQQLVG